MLKLKYDFGCFVNYLKTNPEITHGNKELLTRAQSKGIIKADIRKRRYIGVKIIPLSDLEANTDKYIEIAQAEDVFITENGKTVAKLTAYTEGQKEAGE